MSSTRVGREGSVAISKALQKAKRLRHLNIGDNTFGSEGAAALVELIEGAEALEEIILRDISVEEDDMVKILKAVARSSANIKVLDISTNELTAEIAPAIVEMLRSKPSLEKLYVEENELGNVGVTTIAIDGLSEEINLNLTEIHLADNQIGTKGAKIIGERAKALPKLTRIDLNSNTIKTDAVDELTEMLADILGDMDENDPDDGGEDDDDDKDDSEEASGDDK